MLIPFCKHTLKRYVFRYSKRPSNCCIIHFGRVGSTVLSDMVNQHPDVYLAGEIWEEFRTGNSPVPFPYNRARHLLAYYANDTRHPVFGFEVKLFPEEHLRPSLLNCSIQEALQMFKREGVNQYIFIERKNHLKRSISDTRGLKSGVWHIRDGSSSANTNDERIYLDPKRIHFGNVELPILVAFRRLEEYKTRILEQMARESCLHLVYEDDISESPLIAYNKVSDFLGLSAFEPEVRFTKTNPKKWFDIVSNPQEIEEVLRPSEFSWMLDQ